MSLSPAQVRALRVLASAPFSGSRTSNRTGGLFVHGGTARSLERRGLVSYVPPRGARSFGYTERYKLTTAGLAECERLGIRLAT